MKYFYKNIELEIPENVYEPREDSLLIAKVLEKVRGKKVLEIGCGSGLLSIILAKNFSARRSKPQLYNKVTAVDINKEAVDAAMRNSKLNDAEIEVLESNLFSKIKEKYDLIVFNPPYLPDEDKIRAEEVCEAPILEGNETWSNKGAIERFIKQAKNFLNKNGKILIVISSLTGIERVRKLLRMEGFKTRIVAEQKIPWEKLIVLEAKLLNFRPC